MKYPVTVLQIPATGMTPVVHFNAILQETTNSCLMLESFYNEFVANKATKGPYYQKFSLASRGISHCVFQSALGELQEDSHWKNRSAPDFKVVGITCVPVALDGHLFAINFFLLDHIFSSHGLEAAIFAFLGSSFSRENFIRTQWTGGHELKPPPLVTDPINDPAGEGEGIGEVMKFSVKDLIYKKFPHLLDKARLAIEEFPRTPKNARHALLS